MVRSPPSRPAGCPRGLPASRASRHGTRCSCGGDGAPRLGHGPSEEQGRLGRDPAAAGRARGPRGRAGGGGCIAPSAPLLQPGDRRPRGARGAAPPAPCPAAARPGLPVSRHGGVDTAPVPGRLALRRLGSARGVPAGWPRGCLPRCGAPGGGGTAPPPLGCNGSCCRLACGRAFRHDFLVT